MHSPLAIFAPQIGERSETFIRRHIGDLLPGQTAVVGYSSDLGAGDWSAKGPFLDLRPLHRRIIRETVTLLANITPFDSLRRFEPAERFLKSHDVQVMMGEYLAASLPWLKVAQNLEIPFLGHAHGFDVSAQLREPRWRQEYLRYNESKGIVTISESSRSDLLELGLAADKLHVVPYGVDVPDSPRQRIEDGTVRCLAVGRMVPKKAPLITLEAFRRASQACPELKLDYVGEGPLLADAKKFIQKSDLEEKVILHLSQPNRVVQDLMKSADLFLQHSVTDPKTGDAEGLPVAILEAMAHALPVVSTRHAGIPEAVVDGATGYLVDEGDTKTMADLISMLARDGEQRQQLGRAGWARAKEFYSWERERSELLQILGLG